MKLQTKHPPLYASKILEGSDKDMRLLASPWTESFDSLTRSITHKALIVSPFISREPLKHLASILDKRSAVKIQILTSLNIDNIVQGTIDIDALASFCRVIHDTTVYHLPHLHAKVYVADNTLAILTSANFTRAGINQNYEYGIEITDPLLISKIYEDLRAY